MGKGKKIKKLASGAKGVSIGDQLAADLLESGRSTPRQKGNRRRTHSELDDEDDGPIDAKLSRKILATARLQQEEVAAEFGTDSSAAGPSSILTGKDHQIKLNANANSSDDDSDDEGGEKTFSQLGQVEAQDQFYEDLQIDPDDERALDKFRPRQRDHGLGPAAVPTTRTLADLIEEKMREKRSELETRFSEAASFRCERELAPEVVKLYRGVGEVLSKYRSGKLPKAFKIIPSVANWEQILALTTPENWTAASMYQATRLFTANLKENMAQRFFNLILLPRVRDDIAEYKRLNFHLYQAIRKAMYKTGAFFKGIVLPLCESGDCSLREAVIISSVLSRNHIPLLHSAAAMLKIAEMEYSGPNSVFLHVLIGKNYALPYRVIDGLVGHFLTFRSETRHLPVLWHQVLLRFVQLYGRDISTDQKEAILDLIKVQTHYLISPEIRKVIRGADCRDIELDAPTEEPADMDE